MTKSPEGLATLACFDEQWIDAVVCCSALFHQMDGGIFPPNSSLDQVHLSQPSLCRILLALHLAKASSTVDFWFEFMPDDRFGGSLLPCSSPRWIWILSLASTSVTNTLPTWKQSNLQGSPQITSGSSSSPPSSSPLPMFTLGCQVYGRHSPWSLYMSGHSITRQLRWALCLDSDSLYTCILVNIHQHEYVCRQFTCHLWWLRLTLWWEEMWWEP